MQRGWRQLADASRRGLGRVVIGGGRSSNVELQPTLFGGERQATARRGGGGATTVCQFLVGQMPLADGDI